MKLPPESPVSDIPQPDSPSSNNPPQKSISPTLGSEKRPGRFPARLTLRQAKRVIVLVIGMSVMLLGICLLVLPGPGLVLMASALAILGTEFAIARRWLKKLRQFSNDSVQKLRSHGHT